MGVPAGMQVLTVAALAALPAGATAQTRGRLAVLPLTQLDESAPAAVLDNHTVALTFTQPVPLRELLTLLVRGSAFGVVTDPEIDGTFVGDLKNVTLRKALDQTLDPMGLSYGVSGNVVRIFRRGPQTRIFDINYIAAERSGTATIGGGEAGGAASVTTTAKSDVFADVAAGVKGLLSRDATFNVDRKAGLVQVTDSPDRLERVAVYLDAVEDRVHRQAQIDIRVVEVELSDEKAAGIDWSAIAAQMRVSNDRAGNAPSPPRASLTGMRIMDANRLLTLLEAQGKLTVVAAPRVLTMNNEPAIVRSGAVTFSVTPQIADDSLLTLSLSPIVAAPALAETDMLARVADGETLVVSGFTRDRETRERKAVGISGGRFGRATVVSKRRVELLVILTPRIVPGMLAQ